MSEQIKQMVNKFLCWKLPKDFAPDCGISFKSESDYEHPEFGRNKYEPVGTNLFTAEQAKEMFEACAGERVLELEKQRDELLVALESLCNTKYSQPQNKTWADARAVLDKVKGGA